MPTSQSTATVIVFTRSPARGVDRAARTRRAALGLGVTRQTFGVDVVEPDVDVRHRVPASAMVVEAMSVTSNAMVFMVRSVLL